MGRDSAFFRTVKVGAVPEENLGGLQDGLGEGGMRMNAGFQIGDCRVCLDGKHTFGDHLAGPGTHKPHA